jgi:hypothetical protein
VSLPEVYHLRMSRREIVENTVLGVGLILAFALIVVAGFAAFFLAIRAAGVIATFFFPGIQLQKDVVFYGSMTTCLLVSAVRYLRERHWRWAFLTISASASLGLMALNNFLHAKEFDGVSFTFLILCSLPVESDAGTDLERRWFFINASAIAAVCVLITGLLGSGEMGQIASYCLTVAFWVWAIAAFCRRWLSNHSDSGSLSTTA